MYDKPEAVQEALEKVIPFFNPIWDKFHEKYYEKCTHSWCCGQIARHVINQLADKQTIKQIYLLVSQQKYTNPIQLIARLYGGCTESCSTEAGHAGTGYWYANLTGEDLDIQANSVIAARKPVMLNV